jgi:hypothetical protein
MDVRLTGTIPTSGPGSVAASFLEMARPVGGVVTVAASRDIVNIGTDLTSKSTIFDTYTHEITDPFITDGVQFNLRNNFTGAMNITNVRVVIKGTRH